MIELPWVANGEERNLLVIDDCISKERKYNILLRQTKGFMYKFDEVVDEEREDWSDVVFEECFLVGEVEGKP